MCPIPRKLEFLVLSDATTWGLGLTAESTKKSRLLKHHMDKLSDSFKVTLRFEKKMTNLDFTPCVYPPANTDRARPPKPHPDVVAGIKELGWVVSRK
jgi:hypothetical protein